MKGFSKIFHFLLITHISTHVIADQISPLMKNFNVKRAIYNGELKSRSFPLRTNIPLRRSAYTQNKPKQTPANDRIYFKPYKFPFWGLPYGVYSKGGFINPGLFPFVPGGPGFPPYDGVFGGPAGPGQLPGYPASPFPSKPPAPPPYQPPPPPTSQPYPKKKKVLRRYKRPKTTTPEPEPAPEDCECSYEDDCECEKYEETTTTKKPYKKRRLKPTPEPPKKLKSYKKPCKYGFNSGTKGGCKPPPPPPPTPEEEYAPDLEEPPMPPCSKSYYKKNKRCPTYSAKEEVEEKPPPRKVENTTPEPYVYEEVEIVEPEPVIPIQTTTPPPSYLMPKYIPIFVGMMDNPYESHQYPYFSSHQYPVPSSHYSYMPQNNYQPTPTIINEKPLLKTMTEVYSSTKKPVQIYTTEQLEPEPMKVYSTLKTQSYSEGLPSVPQQQMILKYNPIFQQTKTESDPNPKVETMLVKYESTDTQLPYYVPQASILHPHMIKYNSPSEGTAKDNLSPFEIIYTNPEAYNNERNYKLFTQGQEEQNYHVENRESSHIYPMKIKMTPMSPILISDISEKNSKENIPMIYKKLGRKKEPASFSRLSPMQMSDFLNSDQNNAHIPMTYKEFGTVNKDPLAFSSRYVEADTGSLELTYTDNYFDQYFGKDDGNTSDETSADTTSFSDKLNNYTAMSFSKNNTTYSGY